MTHFEEALSLLESTARAFKTEIIKLEKATGSILAEDIFADRDYPPFNRATVDGYAISQTDAEKKINQYRIVETIFAGGYARFKLRSGECYKIMTGAAVPESASILFKVEDAVTKEDVVMLPIATQKLFLNIAVKGQDVKINEVVIKKNTVVNAPVMSALAAVGKSEITVYKMPKVAILTTGDEIVDLDVNVELHEIRNSNAYILRALLQKWRIKPVLIKHVRDSPEALEKSVSKVLEYDMIITSGGVSMGESDYMPHVFSSLGIECIFHKVDIKPGKPIWVGKKENGPIVFGLPGNPFSVQTCFLVFVQHYLNTCLGNPFDVSIDLKLGSEHPKATPLNEFFTVKKLKNSTTLHPLKNNGSGDITAGVEANGIALHTAKSETLRTGSVVKFYPFDRF